MDRKLIVTYWDGSDTAKAYLSINEVLLADYLTSKNSFLTGLDIGHKIVAVKTDQIMFIEEE